MLMILATVAAATVGFGVLLRLLYPWISYDVFYLRRLMKAILPVESFVKKKYFFITLFEDFVKKQPEKTLLVFEDQKFSYQAINDEANKIARAFIQIGVSQGDTVAVMLYNGPAFVWTYLGLLKIGATAGCINTNLRSKALIHCIKATEARVLLVGSDTDLLKAADAVVDDCDVTMYALGEPSRPSGNIKNLQDLVDEQSTEDVDRSLRSDDKKNPGVLVFTSGTTGLPKPAVVTQHRILAGAYLCRTFTDSSEEVFYTALPLYHSSALLLSLGGAVANGATLVLRKKFSVSYFWEDCQKHNVTIIMYIGELCRYLLSAPKKESDGQHCVKYAYGNGLRHDIWEEFQSRFRISNIIEFYAATEGPVGTINVFNKVGVVGRSSPLLRKVLPVTYVKFDPATELPVRDDNGHCIPIKTGDKGLFLTKLIPKLPFEGYRGNKTLTEKKIVHDVFVKGDRYFNSGDVFFVDEEYFLYFHDRIGDTFRWKGENVSTIEVSNVIADVDFVSDACVYGVVIPGCEGRAGMATITCCNGEKSLSPDQLDAMAVQCQEYLPSYARPRFLRVKQELAVTSTFKQNKLELTEEGFQVDKIQDSLYYLEIQSGQFKDLTTDIHQKILNCEVPF